MEHSIKYVLNVILINYSILNDANIEFYISNIITLLNNNENIEELIEILHNILDLSYFHSSNESDIPTTQDCIDIDNSNDDIIEQNVSKLCEIIINYHNNIEVCNNIVMQLQKNEMVRIPLLYNITLELKGQDYEENKTEASGDDADYIGVFNINPDNNKDIENHVSIDLLPNTSISNPNMGTKSSHTPTLSSLKYTDKEYTPSGHGHMMPMNHVAEEAYYGSYEAEGGEQGLPYEYDWVTLAESVITILNDINPLQSYSNEAIITALHTYMGDIDRVVDCILYTESICNNTQLCRHALNSKCYRSDCMFEHEFSRIPCIYWLTCGCQLHSEAPKYSMDDNCNDPHEQTGGKLHAGIASFDSAYSKSTKDSKCAVCPFAHRLFHRNEEEAHVTHADNFQESEEFPALSGFDGENAELFPSLLDSVSVDTSGRKSKHKSKSKKSIEKASGIG